jgi:hypothetical protein
MVHVEKEKTKKNNKDNAETQCMMRTDFFVCFTSDAHPMLDTSVSSFLNHSFSVRGRSRPGANPWHIPGTSLAHPWHIPGTSLAHLWHISGTSLAHLWHISGTSLAHLWHGSGTALAHPWHIPGTFQAILFFLKIIV